MASSPYNDTRALALSTSAWCSASPRSGSLSDIFSDKGNWRQSLSTSSRTNYSPVAFDPRVLLYIHVSFLPSPTDSSQIACKVGWCPKVPCPNSIVYHFVPKNCHKWDIPPFRTKPFPLFISWIPIFDLENPNFAPTSWLPPSYYEILIKGCSNGFKTGTIWEAFRLTCWSHSDSWHWDILWDVDLPLCPAVPGCAPVLGGNCNIAQRSQCNYLGKL